MATYYISDVYDLQAINPDYPNPGDPGHLADDCVLVNDIDCSVTASWNPDGLGGYYGFVPIGMTSPYFSGSFDGQNHTISNLYIRRTAATHYAALVALTVSGGSLIFKDLTLANVDITGVNYTAGLIAYKNTPMPTISNIHVTGRIEMKDPTYSYSAVAGLIANGAVNMDDCSADVSIYSNTLSSGRRVGGFTGIINSGTFNNCSAKAYIEVTAFGSGGGRVGGFHAGGISPHGDCYFNDCSSECTIIVNGTLSGTTYIGGFAGSGAGTGGMDFNYCYTTGSIQVNAEGAFYVGGFFGYYLGTMIECWADVNINVPNATGTLSIGGFCGHYANCFDCYSRGDVMLSGCSSANAAIGGFHGETPGGNVRCYSIGKVGKYSTYGGFAGKIVAGSFTDCYFDKDTAGTIIGAGSGSEAGLTGKTTDEMKDEETYTNWDFTNVWEFI